MEKVIETSGKSARASLRFYRVTECHLFERENHAVLRSLFGADRAGCDLGVIAFVEKPRELVPVKRLFPAPMCLQFVTALPGQIRFVAKSLREKTEKFPA